MDVDREMGRYPIDHDAEPGRVGAVDETREVLGAAEAAGGREETHRLVPP